MTKTLRGIVSKYGTATVIARLMEQIRLLSLCNDISDEVAETVNQYAADTEFIYSLCKYTNLITYTSEKPALTDQGWEDEDAKEELEEYAKSRKSKGGTVEISLYLLPSQV